MGCFATACGKEQQNVLRGEHGLTGKGNVKTNTKWDSFAAVCERRLWSDRKSSRMSLQPVKPQEPSGDELPKLVAAGRNGNT